MCYCLDNETMTPVEHTRAVWSSGTLTAREEGDHVGRSPGWQPVYQRIADDLRSAIMSGELAPGDQLPTEHALAEQYRVSRTTVRQGLAMLVQEGLAVSKRPRGHFVRHVERIDLSCWEYEQGGDRVDAWVAAVKQQGRTPGQEIRVEILEPSAEIADRLGLSASDLVVARRRVRYVDDGPYAIADSYYPEAIVRGTAIARPADIPTGARHVLAELGHKWATHDDEIIGRLPTDAEARLLNIPPGLAVLVHTRTSRRADGVASRCMVSVLPVDRWRLLYRIGS